MSLYRRLRQRAEQGRPVTVAVAGAGLIGRGLVHQLAITPGLRPALLINRTPARAVAALRAAGFEAAAIVVSDDAADLTEAVRRGRCGIATRLEVLAEMRGLDVLVEVTGAVAYGARAAVTAIDAGLHVVMMNAETDATVGCALKARADAAGVVYSNSDGDQPGVLMRLVEFVEGLGFETVAAVNCKGFMDVHATPESVAPWAKRQGTSPAMTTAFTDGTKMNIENAVLANATGLRPEVRGMHGVPTTRERALEDCLAVFEGTGLVDYTLGGDFGGGVFVIARGGDPGLVRPFMRYVKMGEGPAYIFHRPYHLCHLETPLSIAEAALDGEPTIAPLGAPVADVVTIAKRPLAAGAIIDGIGGFDAYGEVDIAVAATGLLPVGLAAGAELLRDVPADQPIPLDAVRLACDPLLLELREEQERVTLGRAA